MCGGRLEGSSTFIAKQRRLLSRAMMAVFIQKEINHAEFYFKLCTRNTDAYVVTLLIRSRSGKVACVYVIRCPQK